MWLHERGQNLHQTDWFLNGISNFAVHYTCVVSMVWFAKLGDLCCCKERKRIQLASESLGADQPQVHRTELMWKSLQDASSEIQSCTNWRGSNGGLFKLWQPCYNTVDLAKHVPPILWACCTPSFGGMCGCSLIEAA